MTEPRSPLTRFSDRVNDYVKYRPHYPEAVLAYLIDNQGLKREDSVADVGSGTGIFSELLLKNGNPVWGVEPNAEMRLAAESYLSDYKKFTSVAGSAETTGLRSEAAQFVTVAQAFHWFDHAQFKMECQRILKPDGKVILIWNSRKSSGSGFLTAYESLLAEFASDYKDVNHVQQRNKGVIERFYSPHKPDTFSCPNSQRFNFDGLKGRLLSSSYAPKENNSSMMNKLRAIFEEFQKEGTIEFEYVTDVFAGAVHE